MCLTLLVEPSQVKWFFEKRIKASKIVPVVFMLVVLVATAYIQTPLEPGVIRASRAMAFTLLSFAWIYVVGIHTQHGIEYLKETSCQFVARLAPVLYSPLWLASVFVPAAVAALMVQYTRLSHPSEEKLQSSPLQIAVVGHGNSEAITSPAVGTTSADTGPSVSPEDDVQELFRLAKMGRAPRVLETVPEHYPHP
jgi:hypothetical protein